MQAAPADVAAAAAEGAAWIRPLIEVVGAAAVALITYFSATRQARIEVKAAEDKAAIEKRSALEEAESHRKAVVNALPFAYSMHECHMYLTLHKDGGGKLVRECVKISSSGSTDCRIPYRSGTGPNGQFGEFRIEALPAPQPGMRWEPFRTTGHVFEGDIVLPRSLFETRPEVGYRITHEVRSSFLTHEEQAQEAFKSQRFKYEYFGISVIVPVQVLIVEVTFPDAYRAVIQNAFGTVFYGDSEYINSEEQSRIDRERCFTVSGNTARLRVGSPERGHQYAIAWTPPPKAAIESA